MPPHPRQGSMLLLVLALVAAASMIAFGFVAAARANRVAGEHLLSAELARSAARMGARHAVEVALGELSKSYSTGEWSLMHLGHLDRDLVANNNPYPTTLDEAGDLATYNDSDDNVRAESALYRLQHSWFGDQGAGQAYRPDGGSWPWGDLPDRNCSLLNPCMPRWIEPGYYNRDGFAKPVRFTTVPTSTPERNSPMYFDQRWRPVASRTLARYRLRYAVAAVDLGGHLLWGRQLPFDAGNAYSDASATPHEWDEQLNRKYLTSFVAMICRRGVEEYSSSSRDLPRPGVETMFLGRGSTVGIGNNPKHQLTGFGAGPQVLPYSTLGTWIDPAYINIQTDKRLIADARGGPMSWWQAAETTRADAAMGWLGEWALSPFGRANAYDPSPAQYWESKVETPWRVNLLTAPASTIKSMLYGYMPQALFRQPVTKKQIFEWKDWKKGTNWWEEDEPEWEGTAASTDTYSPPIASSLNFPGPDIQDDAFTVPGPAKPFAGFTAVNYSSLPKITDPNYPLVYALAYPGPAEDWEDYAATEMDASKTAHTGADKTAEIHKLMLGTQVNVWHLPDSSKDWVPPPAAADLDRRSILCPNITWWGNPDGTGNKHYSAMPGEPMRGSMAMIAHSLDWGDDQSIIKSFRTKLEIDTDRGFFHRDSYWLDVLNATAEAIALTKALHQDATCVGPASIPTYVSTLSPAGTAPAKPTHIREVDRLMLAVLGEWFPGDATKPGSSTTTKPGHILAVLGNGAESKAKSPRFIFDWRSSANIRGVKEFLSTAAPNGPALTADKAARKAANMERVLNDWRMSFFGANPTYSDFKALDFDYDSYACCSCYSGTSAHPTLTLSNGQTIPAGAATNGVANSNPPKHFSLTGYFVFDRVRYVRALVRGQVWDELRRQAVEEANLETVFAIDPDGNYNSTTKTGLDDSVTLYQRWLTNHYAGETVRTSE